MSPPDVSDPGGEAPPPTRIEELVGRASVLARRLARPVGIAGWIALAAGAVVWLILPAPVWPDRPPWWSSAASLVVLCAPGGWLLFHRWWLDRAFVRAAELAPAATATALQTYAMVQSSRSRGAGDPDRGAGQADEEPVGRLRRAWRFYRGTVSPLRSHVSDALGVTAPLRPLALMTSGVALLLTLALLVCVPIAVVVRLALLVT